MSLSCSQEKAVNPAKKFIKYSGKSGKFSYWDKEKSENVEIKSPFSFIVLDVLASVTGYSKKEGVGIWSNAVRNTTKAELTVKTFEKKDKAGKNIKGSSIIIGKGLYQEIKPDCVAAGAKYTANIYAWFNNEIVHIELKGSGFGGWIEKKVDHNKDIVKISGAVLNKDGPIPFYVPTIVSGGVIKSAKDYEEAFKADGELQAYLDGYLGATAEEPLPEDDGVTVIEGDFDTDM